MGEEIRTCSICKKNDDDNFAKGDIAILGDGTAMCIECAYIEMLIEDVRLMEKDHLPDGYPAMQMKDITALCNHIEGLRCK